MNVFVKCNVLSGPLLREHGIRNKDYEDFEKMYKIIKKMYRSVNNREGKPLKFLYARIFICAVASFGRCAIVKFPKLVVLRKLWRTRRGRSEAWARRMAQRGQRFFSSFFLGTKIEGR